MADERLARAVREYATLIQRAGFVGLPAWLAQAISGGRKFLGFVGAGSMGPPVLAGAVGVVACGWLWRRHRARFGHVTPGSPAAVVFLAGMMLFSLLLTLALGNKFLPSPILFAGGVFFLFAAVFGESRVSWHWLVPAAGHFWMSVLPIVGPVALFRDGIEPMVTGVTCALAALVEGVQTERAVREVKHVVHPGGAHAS